MNVRLNISNGTARHKNYMIVMKLNEVGERPLVITEREKLKKKEFEVCKSFL